MVDSCWVSFNSKTELSSGMDCPLIPAMRKSCAIHTEIAPRRCNLSNLSPEFGEKYHHQVAVGTLVNGLSTRFFSEISRPWKGFFFSVKNKFTWRMKSTG